MSEYQPPNWRDALRVYAKALRIVVEPAMVAVVMLALGVPWWGFVVLVVLWLPLARIRLRQLRDDWAG
jgi:hypothetical protein